MMTGEQNTIDRIVDQLTYLTKSVDNLTKVVEGLDSRLSTVELNNAAFKVGFDKDMQGLCSKLGLLDGFAVESRADREKIHDRINTSNHRISKLEWSTNLLWVAAGLIIGTGVTAITGGVIAKLLGLF